MLLRFACVCCLFCVCLRFYVQVKCSDDCKGLLLVLSWSLTAFWFIASFALDSLPVTRRKLGQSVLWWFSTVIHGTILISVDSMFEQ